MFSDLEMKKKIIKYVYVLYVSVHQHRQQLWLKSPSLCIVFSL